jgi:hypothetical protein
VLSAERVNRVVQGVPAGEPDPHAVGRHLLEVAGGGHSEVLLEVPGLAVRHDHRVPEVEALHERRLEPRPLGQLDLDPDDALGKRPLEEARNLRGGHPELAGDLVLVALGPIIELHAAHHLAELVLADRLPSWHSPTPP